MCSHNTSALIAHASQTVFACRVRAASADLKAENSLDQPTRLAPVDKSLIASSSGFDLRLDPQSFTVIRAKYSNRSA